MFPLGHSAARPAASSAAHTQPAAHPALVASSFAIGGCSGRVLIMGASWRMLLLAAAVVASSTTADVLPASCATFVVPPLNSHHCRVLCLKFLRPGLSLLRPVTALPSSPLQKSSLIDVPKSPTQCDSQSLQEQILLGATNKLLHKESSDSAPPPKRTRPPLARETNNIPHFSYYIREGKRSGELVNLEMHIMCVYY